MKLSVSITSIKRVMALILFCILTLFGVISCSNCSQPSQKGIKGSIKPSLSIYYMDFDNNIKNAVNEFNNRFDNIKIKGKEFASGSSDNYANFITTFSAEIMAGAGPDIIVFEPYFLNSLSKVISSGVFYDLNELISKDKEFNMTEYNRKIFDCGVFNGKRYFIPKSYIIPTFITTKKILNDNKISIDESNWTWNDLLEYVNRFLVEKKGDNKYFFNSNMNFLSILESIEIPFIDYNKRKSNFNCKEFKELLKIYKSIRPAICPNGLYNKYGSRSAMLENKACILYYDIQIGNPSTTCFVNSEFNSFLNEDMEIIRMPNYSSSGNVYPGLHGMTAINSGCKNKEAAFDFMKILISENLQMSQYKSDQNNFTFGIPVNNNAFRKGINSLIEDNAKGIQYFRGNKDASEPSNVICFS